MKTRFSEVRKLGASRSASKGFSTGRHNKCAVRLVAALAQWALLSATTTTAHGQSVQPIAAPAAEEKSTGIIPAMRVKLTRPIYYIETDRKTGDPIAPRDILATATLDGWPPEVPKPSTFTWHVFLDWDLKPFPTHHSIAAHIFEQPSPFQVSLGTEIRGGRLKVIAKTIFGGREITAQAIAEVRGENPPRAAVLRRFPPNRIGLIASKIAAAESGMHQFNPEDGMPVVSRTNDLGMMQLNVPTNAVTSADQVWDWRANLKRGLEVMDDKRRTTEFASRGSVSSQPGLRDIVTGYEDAACLNVVRWYFGMAPIAPPIVPALSSQPGSGMLRGEEDPDHVELSMLERDAIRRYNGGHEYALAIVTDPSQLSISRVEWQVDPLRGGIRARSGDPDYIDHVLRARSGFVIPSPVVATSRHRRIRHRRHR